MRTIDRSTRFKRDYKRESKGRHRATLDADLLPVLAALATDTPLDPKYRDHDLSGDWAGYRDCHVKPDLVLIYAKPDDDTLRLARPGSHSEVFGLMTPMPAIFNLHAESTGHADIGRGQHRDGGSQEGWTPAG